MPLISKGPFVAQRVIFYCSSMIGDIESYKNFVPNAFRFIYIVEIRIVDFHFIRYNSI